MAKTSSSPEYRLLRYLNERIENYDLKMDDIFLALNDIPKRTIIEVFNLLSEKRWVSSKTTSGKGLTITPEGQKRLAQLQNEIDEENESEKQKILDEARRELEFERTRIRDEAAEIQKIKDQLNKDAERVLEQERKLNDFTKKLEIADKNLDFQSQASSNIKMAIIWATLTALLITTLFLFLLTGLDSNDAFSKIATTVLKDITSFSPNASQDLLSSTIYFTYSKYVFTKLLLYSLLLYAIVFCVKNYNAQMHNKIINAHKANALRSTLSIIGTAKSDEGNDKLLVQATQAIFAHQNTGYSGKDAEPPSPNLVTNVIDAAAKKS